MKFIQLIKKYKVYVLTGLLVVFFFRSCIKSVDVRKGGNTITNQEIVIDSLKSVINEQKLIIGEYPKTLRLEKIKLHSEYDNYISKKDRGNQLMELHMIVKENLKELQK